MLVRCQLVERQQGRHRLLDGSRRGEEPRVGAQPVGGGSFGAVALSQEDTVAAASFSSALKAVASLS